jgi:DNA ligase (NAD+)
MDKNSALKLMDELINKISQWDYSYYILNKPEVEDNFYDIEMKRLEAIEKEFPELRRPDSPTLRVGGSVAAEFDSAGHARPMLSLDNTYSEAELIEFDQKNIKNLEVQNIDYTVELKYDGLSVSVIYEKGILVRALTRGDGLKGEIITENIKTVRTLPLRLARDIDLEVRGEAVMPFESFKSLNKARLIKNEQPFANPRNAAAGSLRLLDSSVTASRKLDIYIYDLFMDLSFNTESNILFNSHHHKFEILKKLGFKVSEHVFRCSGIKEVIKICREYYEKKKFLEFEVDGLVIKVDNLDFQKKLGSTSKSPRWAKAYKFPAARVITRIENIILQVGKSGTVTPVAVLTPVQISGSMVSRASLHNEDEIIKKDIRINDIVEIEKAGEIIPQVVRAIKEERNGNEIEFKMPENCPCCGQKLKRIETEARVKCVNPECSAMAVRKIIHFASRDCMNIDGIGIRNIEIFFDLGLIKDPSDLYELTKKDIQNIPGFGEKSAEKIIESIDKSRDAVLDRFITALNIPFVGKNTARVLSKTLGNIHNIIAADYDLLIEIKDLGEKTVRTIIDYFSEPKNKKYILKLLESINLSEEDNEINDDPELISESLINKNFVITGTLESMTRNEAAKIIFSRGGHVMTGLSKNTDYLIAGKKAGSKLKKAEMLGITVLDEDDFLKMVQKN